MQAFSRDKTRLFLSFDDLLADWRVTATKVSNALDMQFAITPDVAAAVEAFLDPQLRHFHETKSEHSEGATNGGALQEFCAAAYGIMRKAVGRDLSTRELAALDHVRERFETWSADHIVAEILHEQARTRNVAFGLNDRVAAMQTAAIAADSQIASQRAQLEELQRAHVQDAASLSDTQRRNDALSADVSGLNERVTAMQTASVAADAQIASQRARLEESSRTREQDAASLRDAQERNADLAAKVSVLIQQGTAEAERASARAAELEAKLALSREHRAKLEAQLSAVGERVDAGQPARDQALDEIESRLCVEHHSKRIEGALRESLRLPKTLTQTARRRSAIVAR
jgi:chromosome segregation ATPase